MDLDALRFYGSVASASASSPGSCPHSPPPQPLALASALEVDKADGAAALTRQLAADARALLAALRAEQQVRSETRRNKACTTQGLAVLLGEAEEAMLREGDLQTDLLLPGTLGTNQSCKNCSLMLQEVTDLQAKRDAVEAELHACEAGRIQDAELQEAKSAGQCSEMEEFAKACAEVLLGAGAAQEQASMEARQALQAVEHYQAEVPNLEVREEIAARRSELLEARQSQLLAVSEEGAAQAFRAACAEEEVARMREWSLAYEAAAKAEVLTAQRCRSEMATAMQELQRFHRMRQLHQSFSFPQAQLRLESIPEGENSVGSCGEEGGETDGLDAEHSRESESMPGERPTSLASTEADENDHEEMQALILKLQGELLDAEVDRAKALSQRDEAHEALAALREENEELNLALQLCADLPEAPNRSQMQLPCLPGYIDVVTDPAGRLQQANAFLNQAMADLASLRNEA